MVRPTSGTRETKKINEFTNIESGLIENASTLLVFFYAFMCSFWQNVIKVAQQ